MVGIRKPKYARRFVSAGLVVVAAVGISGLAGRDSASRLTVAQNQAAAGARPTVRGFEDAPDGVALHTCPSEPDIPVGQNPWGLVCYASVRLAAGTALEMHCWVSTQPPRAFTVPAVLRSDHLSAKWFSVTVLDGAYAGKHGWIWSDLVADQTPGRPLCDHIGHEKDPPPKPLPSPTFIVVGRCNSDGKTLHARAANFLPLSPVKITVSTQTVPASTVQSSEVTSNEDGSVGWQWSCAGRAGAYSVSAADVLRGQTAYAGFVVESAPPRAVRPPAPKAPAPVVRPPKPQPKPSKSSVPPSSPKQVSIYDTLAAAPVGEFTCSRDSGYASSWAVQSFVIPGNVRYLEAVAVGVGARDGFAVSLRRSGSQIAGVWAPGGLDEIITVNLGRVPVNPGETLELWVGDAEGWTNGGSRSPSKLFSVVRTQVDVYGSGNYRTTNACPNQAKDAQSFTADMQARIVGWDR